MYKALLPLITNKFLIAAVLAWFVCQALKFIFGIITTRRFCYEKLVSSGGMPSSHSGAVCALAVSLGRSEFGMGSPFFALTVLFALIVMYDAMNVRRSCGEQAKALNQLLLKYHIIDEETKALMKKEIGTLDDEDNDDDSEEIKRLKEVMGHTPLQVVAGAVIGVGIGFFL